MQGMSWQRPSSPHTVDVYDLREVRCTTALIPLAGAASPSHLSVTTLLRNHPNRRGLRGARAASTPEELGGGQGFIRGRRLFLDRDPRTACFGIIPKLAACSGVITLTGGTRALSIWRHSSPPCGSC